MANLDAVYKLTEALPYPSLTEQEKVDMKVADERELTLPGTKVKLPEVAFFFADICAGPGGFTEYLLWRAQRREQAKMQDRYAVGWGYTLRVGDGIDFDLDKFNRGKFSPPIQLRNLS
jgi:hypothetical protein